MAYSLIDINGIHFTSFYLGEIWAEFKSGVAGVPPTSAPVESTQIYRGKGTKSICGEEGQSFSQGAGSRQAAAGGLREKRHGYA